MRLIKSILIQLILCCVIVPLCHGESLYLEWNPNGESDLAGYKVYYGTSSGNYGNPIDVGNATAYELTGVTASVRYYVAITAYDTADNESEKSDEVSGIATDNHTSTTTTTQPGDNGLSGSIIINNGEEVTTSREVTLSLYASVDVPQLASASLDVEELGPDAVMSISNDGQQWSALEPYKQTKLWTLEPGNGLKTVYAGFRDGKGNWISEPVQDQIILDEAQTTCGDPQKIHPIAVKASSTSPRYPADNLIDGDPSTIWSSVVSLFKKDTYITLDLGTIKKVSELTLYASRLFGVDFFPTNFKIQVSQDNSTWLDISTVQGFVFGQSLTSGSWSTNGLECRYIRIYITQSKALFLLFKLAQIAEIEVYGCDSSGEPFLVAGESSFTQSNRQRTATEQKQPRSEAENQNTIPGTPSRPTITFLE